jgi:hypothetical protein
MINTPLLISQYLDDDLDDQSADLLTESLRDNASATDDLVIASYIHSQLFDLMGQRRVQDNVANDSFMEDDFAYSERQTASRSAGRFGVRRPLGLAAALMVAASVFALAYWSLTRPVIIGQLSRCAGCRWQAPEGNLPVGTLLRAGQELRLVEGRALVTFASGVQIVLEGPTRLRLDSEASADLSNGRITTNVPSQAIGFTITSPIAKFVDLGTEFGLRMNAGEGFELHVFDGLVEVQLAQRDGEVARKPLRISEISAIRYNAESDDVALQPYDQSERMSL